MAFGVTLPIELGKFPGRARRRLQLHRKGPQLPADPARARHHGERRVPALVGTPGDVFTDENILDPDNDFVLSLGGIGTESYLAGETVDAVWGKVDVTWNDTWRLAAGARWEDFSQLSVPIDQYEFDPDDRQDPDPGGPARYAGHQRGRLLPGGRASPGCSNDFWAERFQLRFGWSETTARPDLREISDATFIDPLTEARVTGNPDLVAADLANFDVRAEWFFDSGDNFTVSLFYKDIEAPIETIEGAGTDDNISLTLHQRGIGGDLRRRVRVAQGARVHRAGLGVGRCLLRVGQRHAERVRDHDRGCRRST